MEEGSYGKTNILHAVQVTYQKKRLRDTLQIRVSQTATKETLFPLFFMKDYFSAWRAMEDAYREGKLKAIGVSNFYPATLTNFCETVEIKPMVNQIETHPYYTQDLSLEVMDYCGVVPEPGHHLVEADMLHGMMKCSKELPKYMEKQLDRLF